MTTRIATATPASSPRGPDIVSALREVDRHLSKEAPSRALEARILGATTSRDARGTKRAYWLVPAVVAAIVAILILRQAPAERRESMPVPTSGPTAIPEVPRVGEGEILAPETGPVQREAPSPRERAPDADVEHDEERPRRDSREHDAPRTPSWTSPPTRSLAPQTMFDDGSELDAPDHVPESTTSAWRPTRRAPALHGVPPGRPVRRGPAPTNDRGDGAAAPPSESGPGAGEPSDNEGGSGKPSAADTSKEPIGEEPGEATGAGCDGLDGLGVYSGYFCSSDEPFILTEDLSCQDALENCEHNADTNTTLSYVCTWSGVVIHVREVETEECSALLSELDDPSQSAP